MLHTHFIAGVTALAIGITGLSAAPARADDNTARVLTGLAAIAIVGAAIADNKRERDHAVSRSYRTAPSYGLHHRKPHKYRAHGYQRPRLKRHHRHGGHRYYKRHRRGYWK